MACSKLQPILRNLAVRNVFTHHQNIRVVSHGSNLQNATAVSAVAKEDFLKNDFSMAKPMSEMPGKRGIAAWLELIHTLREGTNEHNNTLDKFRKHGPIYLTELGGFSTVFLSDVDAIEKVHRLEGKYPLRIVVGPWRDWRDEHGFSRGILTEDGADWKRMRTQLDKRMMRPKAVSGYTDNFNGVITDLVTHLRQIRKEDGAGVSVPGIDKALFTWSLETICTVLYERRLGGFSENKPEEFKKFIASVRGIFESIEKIFFVPKKLGKIIMPKWFQTHEDSWNTVFSIGQKYLNQKTEEINEKLDKGEDVDGFLSHLIAGNKMSKSEILANVTELMVGAVDTTSNTMQWVIYNLSTHPEIQERLHQEVMEVTKGKHASYDDIQKMNLLRSVIKETLRLYPIAGVSTRVLTEDLVLCGYNIPKGKLILSHTYSTCRDPNNFKDPERFDPDRWLRKDSKIQSPAFAWLPFGFGPRMCAGRRVAELEMHLLTARLVQNFVIEPLDGKPIKSTMRALIVPEHAVNVKLIDRSTAC